MNASDAAMYTMVRLPVVHLGLPHDGEPVRDRLDAGVGAAAQRVGPEEQQQRGRRCPTVATPSRALWSDPRQRGGELSGSAARNPPPIRMACVTRNSRKTGSSASTDSRTPADVQGGQSQHEADLQGQLGAVPGGGQEAEERVAGRRDRDGDGEDVVHQERGAGHDAGRRAQQLGRHDVAAAPAGELLDDPPVGGRDEEHRSCHEASQREGQPGMVLAQRLERLLRAVGRGREPVRAEADPGEERDQAPGDGTASRSRRSRGRPNKARRTRRRRLGRSEIVVGHSRPNCRCATRDRGHPVPRILITS